MKKENTSTRLKQIMQERNLRQVDVLERTIPLCRKYDVKMNKSDISQYVSGKVEPNQDKLFVLSLALNVSEGWLMGFDVSKARASAPADPLQLTDQEARLLGICRSLNEEGRERLAEYGDDLVASGKYIKRTSEYRPVSPIPEKQKAVEDAYKKVLKNVNAKEVEYDDI